MCRGLTIILGKGMQNVKVESNSLIAVKLMSEGPPDGHPHRALVEDSSSLLTRTGATLSHIIV